LLFVKHDDDYTKCTHITCERFFFGVIIDISFGIKKAILSEKKIVKKRLPYLYEHKFKKGNLSHFKILTISLISWYFHFGNGHFNIIICVFFFCSDLPFAKLSIYRKLYIFWELHYFRDRSKNISVLEKPFNEFEVFGRFR